jgi:hypothetical protein
VQRERLAHEPGHVRVVVEDDAPDPERGGDRVDERRERRRLEVPHLDLDRPGTVVAIDDAHQPRLRRVRREGVEPVDRRRLGAGDERRPAIGQLVVQRLPLEMSPDDRNAHVGTVCIRVFRRIGVFRARAARTKHSDGPRQSVATGWPTVTP